MIEKLAPLFIAVIAVPVAILGWLIAAHNIRIWRVRKLYRSLPTGTRERILRRINDVGKADPACMLLVASDAPSDGLTCGDITATRYGGEPYSVAGEQWPGREDDRPDPAEFLMQVRLGEPLPPPWPGRLVVVFLKFDDTQTVRLYEAPSPAKYVSMPGDHVINNPIPLRPIAIPKALSTEEEAAGMLMAYDPVSLLKSVPNLREDLEPFTTRPADLLAQLIVPSHYGYGFDICDTVQVGGEPQWVQDDPGLKCEQCGEPMRLLFQFGDLSGQHLLGDAGVCYVLGCDAHPDHAAGVVQMC